jgi:hypothetical protein
MRRGLALVVPCCVLAACGSGGNASPPIPTSPDTSPAARAIAAWCTARQAEVAPAEIAAIRGQEERARQRLAKMLRESDTSSDPYELVGKSLEATFREEGLFLQLPLPAEVGALRRRLNALPAGSAARAWGDHLAEYRAELLAIDAKLKQGDARAANAVKAMPKPGQLEAQAAKAGVASCARMAINPAEARIYAEIALAEVRSAGTVGQMVDALRRREPWLTARAVPNACALPDAGDPAAGEASSDYAVGIWKDSDATVGVTVSGLPGGGTLSRTASGDTWTPFAVSLADGGIRRVGPCPR